MKPAAFDYLRAHDVGEALEALREAGSEARILAGGQSLVPMLNMRLARPSLLVDIMRIGALRRIEPEDGWLRIGASVRQAELERHLKTRPHPLLTTALSHLGHAQTRARGTVCGSIAHADPSAELPLCLTALEGRVHLASHRGRRTVEASRFFTGMMATARADDEMIEAVSVPIPAVGAGYAFAEVGRRHGDFAIVASAAVADARGLRLAVAGVADQPAVWSAPALEDPAFDAALDQFAWDLDAREDLHATARYRRELVRRLGRRTLEEAQRCSS